MDNSSRVIEVDVNDILPNRNQPRIILNEEDDLGLTDSVKEYGVLQPIIVRTIGDKYEIIAGERRYRASVLAGKDTVPVIVRNMTDRESAEVALIENVQRKELTPIEEALSYKNILDLGYTQEQLAEKIGKSQPAVANKIRLLNLADEVQDALLESKISERHARSLLKIKNKSTQVKMLDRIISERLTVRKTDEEISKLNLSSSDDEGREGETKMNNNEFINMPQFESFTNTTPVQPAVPAAEPQANVFGGMDVAPVAETTPAPSFNIFEDAQPAPQTNTFGLSDVTPVEQPVAQPAVEEVKSEPIVVPASAVSMFEQPAQESSFNIFESAQPAPQTNTFDLPAQPVEQPVIAETKPEPIIVSAAAAAAVAEPTPADLSEITAPIVVPASAVSGFEQATAEQPSMQPIVEPAAPAVESSIIPETAPIQEQPQPAIAETKPEPIIITDYNKQYDPVMPAQPVEPTPQVSFKEVIDAIRECANKIESYGYKIDLDEFDLTNIYQAIFKIEKM